eukprot:2671111-Pleurochrysis_carterae.AAC.1
MSFMVHLDSYASVQRGVFEVRLGKLVAERVQVGDVGGTFAEGVAKSLVQVDCSSLVALSLVSTQRTNGHAEVAGEDRGAFTYCRCATFARRCRLAMDGHDDDDLEIAARIPEGNEEHQKDESA